MKVQVLLISALAGYVSATTYAQFCNDNACNDGCGESVSVDNPGCLNESGRGSIKFHDSNIQDVRLVFSPEQNCESSTIEQSQQTLSRKALTDSIRTRQLPERMHWNCELR